MSNPYDARPCRACGRKFVPSRTRVLARLADVGYTYESESEAAADIDLCTPCAGGA